MSERAFKLLRQRGGVSGTPALLRASVRSWLVAIVSAVACYAPGVALAAPPTPDPNPASSGSNLQPDPRPELRSGQSAVTTDRPRVAAPSAVSATPPVSETPASAPPVAAPSTSKSVGEVKAPAKTKRAGAKKRAAEREPGLPGKVRAEAQRPAETAGASTRIAIDAPPLRASIEPARAPDRNLLLLAAFGLAVLVALSSVFLLHGVRRLRRAPIA